VAKSGDELVSGITILLTSTVLGLALRINESVTANSTAIAQINASRFTADDGLEVWKEIGKIRTEMGRLPTEVPAKWFIERVDKLEMAIDRLGTRIHSLEQRLK